MSTLAPIWLHANVGLSKEKGDADGILKGFLDEPFLYPRRTKENCS